MTKEFNCDNVAKRIMEVLGNTFDLNTRVGLSLALSTLEIVGNSIDLKFLILTSGLNK